MAENIEEQALIPGLPEDIAFECLSRIPHRFHSKIRPVCKKWRDLVTSPSFHRHRERICAAEDLIFLVQALKDDEKDKKEEAVKLQDPVTAGEAKEVTASRPPVYSLSVYNATLATWHRIATPDAIPMFAHIAAVEGKLVLVGGWDPVTLDPVTDVRILDPKTMTWRKGRPITSARSFFACAAAGSLVCVAGGHDKQKNALRSAEAYDVTADEWVSLPPMSEERDESKGLNLGGKFWAVSGYGTENQGRFATSAEWYDPVENKWTEEYGVLEDADGQDAATCAPCFGTDDRMWSMGPRGVREFSTVGREWESVGPAPEGMRSGTCGAVIWGAERAFVSGGEGSAGWVVNLGRSTGRKWVKVETPAGFTGFVYSAAAVRI